MLRFKVSRSRIWMFVQFHMNENLSLYILSFFFLPISSKIAVAIKVVLICFDYLFTLCYYMTVYVRILKYSKCYYQSVLKCSDTRGTKKKHHSKIHNIHLANPHKVYFEYTLFRVPLPVQQVFLTTLPSLTVRANSQCLRTAAWHGRGNISIKGPGHLIG